MVKVRMKMLSIDSIDTVNMVCLIEINMHEDIYYKLSCHQFHLNDVWECFSLEVNF